MNQKTVSILLSMVLSGLKLYKMNNTNKVDLFCSNCQGWITTNTIQCPICLNNISMGQCKDCHHFFPSEYEIGQCTLDDFDYQNSGELFVKKTHSCIKFRKSTLKEEQYYVQMIADEFFMDEEE